MAKGGVGLGRCRVQDVIGRCAQDFGGGDIVQNREAGRDAGLERETLQQALAEGVDRLHLEAAGGFDGVRKERARSHQLGIIRIAREDVGE